MKNISFVTNCSVNTKDHVQLLMKSLRDNLDNKHHEIIVFIDSDNEGIQDYLMSIKHEYEDLKIVTHKIKPCTGYALNNNVLVDLAKYDIVSYLQSDMVIGPHYDTNILKELEDNMILSATRIEPPLHGYSDYTITYDFGTDPTVFDMEKWNKYSEMVKTSQAAEYFFAPITFYKKVWQSIGGYDTIFRRSREDSDFVQRCVHSGIRLVQTWQANVYHFTCVSSRGKNWFDSNNEKAKRRTQLQQLADGIELRRFIRKWGDFNHGDYKLNKLDIDFVVDEKTNMPVDQLVHLEPYFSRIWFKTDEQKELAIKLLSNEHDPANQLFGFSKEDWDLASRYYNVTDYNSVYKVGEPEEYNIKITAEFGKIHPGNDPFFQYITKLGSIIEPYEPGIYELGSVKIEVKSIVSATENQLKVKNPTFDFSQLSIQ